jgi:cytochrome c peroxidase
LRKQGFTIGSHSDRHEPLTGRTELTRDLQGSRATLEAVLDFYAAGGRNIESGPHAGDGRRNPFKSDLVSRIDLNAQEKSDLVAFLKTLTDHDLVTNPKFADPFKK